MRTDYSNASHKTCDNMAQVIKRWFLLKLYSNVIKKKLYPPTSPGGFPNGGLLWGSAEEWKKYEQALNDYNKKVGI